MSAMSNISTVSTISTKTKNVNNVNNMTNVYNGKIVNNINTNNVNNINNLNYKNVNSTPLAHQFEPTFWTCFLLINLENDNHTCTIMVVPFKLDNLWNQSINFHLTTSDFFSVVFHLVSNGQVKQITWLKLQNQLQKCHVWMSSAWVFPEKVIQKKGRNQIWIASPCDQAINRQSLCSLKLIHT